MKNLHQRLEVIATAAVTWIVVASTVLTVVAEELGNLFADGQAATVIRVLLRIVAALGAAVTIIRRVTPVLKAERGLLPTTTPQEG